MVCKTNNSTLLSAYVKNRTCLVLFAVGIVLLLGLLIALIALIQGGRNTFSIQAEDVAEVCQQWVNPSKADEAVPRSGPVGRIWTYDTNDGSSLDLIWDYTVANSLEELDTLFCMGKEVFRSTTHYCSGSGDAYGSITTIAAVDWQAKTLRALGIFSDFMPVCADNEAEAMISSSPDFFKVDEWLVGVENGRSQ
jgi:hypothetical protein